MGDEIGDWDPGKEHINASVLMEAIEGIKGEITTRNIVEKRIHQRKSWNKAARYR